MCSTIRRLLPVLLALTALLVSCGKPDSSSTRNDRETSTNRQVFEVRGVVVELKPERKQVRIKHEEIPDYMPAMTMPFDVKDTNVLSDLKPGDAVLFKMYVTEDEGWIEDIRKTSQTNSALVNTNLLGDSGLIRRVKDVDPLIPGDELPAYQFTNQLGRPFSTAGFKGNALAITFIFTRCPYPTFCPRMNQNFSATLAALKNDNQAPRNWHLLSLSFDPEFDTPSVLKRYAESQNYDPERWTFATGDLTEVVAIAEHFDLRFARDEKGSISHNLRTVVIDPAGKVHEVFDGNEWSPEQLAKSITTAARLSPAN